MLPIVVSVPKIIKCLVSVDTKLNLDAVGALDKAVALASIEPVISIFMRKTFQVENIDNILHGLLHMDYDDGFIAYLNGNEIIRENLGISKKNL